MSGRMIRRIRRSMVWAIATGAMFQLGGCSLLGGGNGGGGGGGFGGLTDNLGRPCTAIPLPGGGYWSPNCP